MRRFLLKIGVFLALQLLIALPLMLQYRGVARHFFAATNEKHALAETAPGPRLIVVGGSNAMYCFDSARIRHLTAHHPVNLSMYAPLGLPFIFSEALDCVRPGDAVLLSLEYQHFEKTSRIPFGDLAILLEARPASVRYVPWRSMQNLFDNGIGWAKDLLFTPHTAWRAVKKGIYVRNGFNHYGDFVAHHRFGSHYVKTRRPDAEFKQEVADEVIDGMNEFVAECRRRNVRVAFVFPAYEEAMLADRAAFARDLETALRSRFIGTMLCSPSEAAHPARFFFDSEYHLTLEGRVEHTRRLLPPLARWLEGENTSPSAP